MSILIITFICGIICALGAIGLSTLAIVEPIVWIGVALTGAVSLISFAGFGRTLVRGVKGA